MKQKNIFSILIMFLCIMTVGAQNDKSKSSVKLMTVEASVDNVFDKTIDFLQDNGHFIVSLDKQAGFIQSKIFVENKKFLSAKVGERRTCNFIIRPSEGNKSKISLSIYIEDQYFNSNSSDRVYYYEEKGICDDSSLYEEIFMSLRIALLDLYKAIN